jgi:hypothetical protein
MIVNGGKIFVVLTAVQIVARMPSEDLNTVERNPVAKTKEEISKNEAKTRTNLST